jgi:hypothetical protein
MDVDAVEVEVDMGETKMPENAGEVKEEGAIHQDVEDDQITPKKSYQSRMATPESKNTYQGS